MIALLDTDVLIDVALDRKPFSEFSSVVLDGAEHHFYRAFIAWHSLANFYYIVTPTSSNRRTRDFVMGLLKFVEVAPTTTKDALYAGTLNFTDFEDALQVAAARACNAEIIVTRNVKHYKRSHIPAHTPEYFSKNFCF
jgi:predicted nucleic acid-binding protein